MQLIEIQKLAALIAAKPLPKHLRIGDVNPDTATFDAWRKDKSLGTPMSVEIPVDDADGGGVAVVTAAGRVLHATPNGDGTYSVEVK